MLRIIDQLYTLHEKGADKDDSSTNIPANGSQDAERESVRDLLRMALTEVDLKNAIDAARALNMSFEVSLGEKKLSKFSH